MKFTPDSKFSIREIIYVFLCVALFSSLVLMSMSKFSVWHDEGYTATLIENSYSGIIERASLDVHPPMYYLILKTWSLLLGDSIATLRLFSLLTMSGAIIVCWLLFRKLFGRKSAAFSILLMCISPFLVRYGQEMRMYGLVALISSVVTYMYVNAFQSRNFTKKYLIIYGALIALGIYSHYFFVIVPIIHFVHSVHYSKYLKKTYKEVVLMYFKPAFFALLLMLPWVPIALNQFIKVQGAFWIEPVGVQTLTNTPIFMTIYRYQSELTGLGGLIAVIALSTVIILLRSFYIKNVNPASRLIFMLVILPPVIFFLVSLPPLQPSYYNRYFSFLATFFYGALAVGALSLKNIKLRRAMALTVLGLLVFGQFNQLKIGNDFEERARPHYTMKHIISRIDDQAPIFSTSLTTFFDARTTARDMGKNDVVLLQSDYPKSWEGNWSALYKREELIVTKIPNDYNQIWLIDESGSNYSSKALDGYWPAYKQDFGYATLTRYIKISN